MRKDANPASAQLEDGSRPALPAWAGPALIAASVLIVMHGFWLRPRLSNQQLDLLGQWLPWYCHLGKAVAHGAVPAWLPTQFSGMPFAGDPQKGWMYLPAMVPFAIFGCARAFGLFVTLQPLVAGLGLFWFLRNEGLSRVAATVGALTLALTIADSAIAISLPFSGMLAWMAVTLGAGSAFLRARTVPGRLGALGATGFALSQAAAAHLSNGLLFTLLGLGAYLVARLASQIRQGNRTLASAGLMLLSPFLAFPLVGAAVLSPPVGFLPRSSLGHGYAELARLATSLSGVPTPPAFTPGQGPWWATGFARGPEGYAGALAILVLPSAFLARRWRAPVVAFAAVGLVGWLFNLEALVTFKPLRSAALGTSIGELWLHSPFRFRYLVVISLAVLAGYGVQSWLDVAGDRRAVVVRASLMAPMVALFVLGPILAGSSARQYLFFAVGIAYALPLLVAANGRWRSAVWLLPVLLAVELATAGLVQQLGTVNQDARDQLDKLPASGLGHSFSRYHTPWIEPDAYLRPGPIGSYLIAARDQYGRYFAFDPSISRSLRGFLTRQAPSIWPAYENGRSVLFGLDDVQGYSPVQVDRYWRLVRRSDDRPLYYNAAAFQSIDRQVLDLFGVRWLIVSSRVDPPADLLQPAPVATEGIWRLFSVRDAMPRASIVYSVRTVTPGQSLDAVLGTTFDPGSEAIVETTVPGLAGSGAGTGTAAYSEPSASHARIVVTTDRPGLLVVRNVFDLNWRAFVDSRQVPLYVTDYLMQGILVPAGRHVIDLEYRDTSIRRGLAISAAAWLLLLAAIVALVVRDRRRRWPARVAPGNEPTR
jgi:hypothetical protein